ncbi:hypothetical protein JW859_03405 [bacterium]|nr:hypothetical protein [bacterium]
MGIHVLGYEFFGYPFNGDTSTFTPENPAHFRVDVSFYVGWQGDTVGHRFEACACSPSAFFTDLVPEDEICSGRHYIIMQKYDEPLLRSFIESFVASLAGLPKPQALEKLCWFAQWEMEDAKWDDGKVIVTHEAILHEEKFGF